MQAAIRTWFGVTSRLLPGVAIRHAERLFMKPLRHASRRTPPLAARRTSIAVDHWDIVVWQAGLSTAPAVLLSHGWGGSGTQMSSFVGPLLVHGYRAVWFDQPGHGESGRGAVGLPDFVRALEALARKHGPFEAAIAHSLGASALSLALRRGLAIKRAVFVAVPASLSIHTHNFARRIGIAPHIREAMRSRLEHRYSVRFEEIDRIEELAKLDLPALFVHDGADAEVPFEHALRMSGHMPGARLIKTHGLGHFGILRDAGVVGAIVGFVGGAVNTPTELPALPQPAPIY